MADWDWLKLAIQGVGYLASSAGGLVLGIWHAGKRSGRQEAELQATLDAKATRTDLEQKVEAMRQEMRTAVGAATDNRELLVGQFQESFAGLRRQMDENRLHTEEHFVRKDAFKEFRDEYREDIKELKAMIRDGAH